MVSVRVVVIDVSIDAGSVMKYTQKARGTPKKLYEHT